MAQQNNMNYWEASAKENKNVSELMEDLMNQVYMTQFAKQTTPSQRPTFKLKSNDYQEDGRGTTKTDKEGKSKS